MEDFPSDCHFLHSGLVNTSDSLVFGTCSGQFLALKPAGVWAGKWAGQILGPMGGKTSSLSQQTAMFDVFNGHELLGVKRFFN